MGYIRTDSGKSVKTGRINSTRSNPRLQQRPDAGRAPNFQQGTSAGSQQSIKPPVKGGGWNPIDWFKGKANAATTTIKGIPGAIKSSVVGTIKNAAPPVLAITGGAVVGEAYRRTDRADAVSGRGAGRATFRDSNNNNRPNPQKPAAPPQAAEKPTVDSNGSNGTRGENRSGVEPVDGSFRTAVEQGPDGDVTPSSGNAGGAQSTDPQGSGYIPPAGPPAGTSSGDTRVTPDGLVSYGRDLSSLNQFTKAFTGGYELTDIKSAFQSNDLEGAYQNGSNSISTEESKYTLDPGATPSNIGGKYTMDGVDTSLENTGYQITPASVPGTVGKDAKDPQSGVSSKPDVAESIRQVRMQRKGPRDDGGPRGFAADQANMFAQNSVSETKGNGMNAKRRAIKDAFFNMDLNSVQASAAANAVAGYGKDSDGNARFNYGGELVYAKEGMQQKAKNAAMMGQDPTQFLDIPEAPSAEQTETTLDLANVDVKSEAFTQAGKEAQEFFKAKLAKTK